MCVDEAGEGDRKGAEGGGGAKQGVTGRGCGQNKEGHREELEKSLISLREETVFERGDNSSLNCSHSMYVVLFLV